MVHIQTVNDLEAAAVSLVIHEFDLVMCQKTRLMSLLFKWITLMSRQSHHIITDAAHDSYEALQTEVHFQKVL